jgi:hypothetical protein
MSSIWSIDVMQGARGRVEQHIRQVARDRVEKGMLILASRMIAEAPVADPDTWKKKRRHVGGRFRLSIMPFLGSPHGDAPAAGFNSYATPDPQEIATKAMQNFEPGTDVGLVSNVAYAERLARGWSPQARDGWVRVIVADTAAELERGE